MKKLPRISVKSVVPCEPMVRVDFEIDDADFEKLANTAEKTMSRDEQRRELVNALLCQAIIESLKCSEDGYICSVCAKRLGGKWPKGHCATQHGGACPFCGQAAALAAIDDWNFAKGKRPQGAYAGRD